MLSESHTIYLHQLDVDLQARIRQIPLVSLDQFREARREAERIQRLRWSQRFSA